MLFVIFYLGILLPSLEYLKDLRNYNTMFAILRYCTCSCVCVRMYCNIIVYVCMYSKSVDKS